jgi:hypothetical protein
VHELWRRYRLSFDNILTVKGHIIEQHVSAFAWRYGTCGTFGEDGLASIHPWDTRCRLITFSLFAFRLVLPEHNLETRPVDMRLSCPFESFGRSSDT